jgi:hypothetical protein
VPWSDAQLDLLHDEATYATAAAQPKPARDATHFVLEAAAYSHAQDAVVATSRDVIVWYDFDALRKVAPAHERWAPVAARMLAARDVKARAG